MDTSIIKCPECYSVNTGTENAIDICYDCGTVVNDIPVRTTSGSSENRTSVEVSKAAVKNKNVGKYFKHYTSTVDPKLTNSVKHGIDVIMNVCKNLHIAHSIMQSSKDLFAKIASKEPFKLDSSNTKLCLALSCLYFVSNREENPITLTELLNSSDCAFDHFGAILLRLEKNYPEIYPKKAKNIETLVPCYLFKLTINDKEKPVIFDYATNLVWMWREALLVQSYNPVYVIYSALYFAWKAVSVDRYQVNCTEFCKRVNIEHKPIISQRVSFYLKILQNFYCCNPLHANTTVSPSLICSKIKEMIAMKRIILWNYSTSPLNFHAQEIKKRKNDNCELPEMSSKKVRTNNSNEDEEDDISDSEIDSYIRSESEVHILERLQESSDEDESDGTSINEN